MLDIKASAFEFEKKGRSSACDRWRHEERQFGTMGQKNPKYFVTTAMNKNMRWSLWPQDPPEGGPRQRFCLCVKWNVLIIRAVDY